MQSATPRFSNIKVPKVALEAARPRISRDLQAKRPFGRTFGRPPQKLDNKKRAVGSVNNSRASSPSEELEPAPPSGTALVCGQIS